MIIAYSFQWLAVKFWRFPEHLDKLGQPYVDQEFEKEDKPVIRGFAIPVSLHNNWVL